MLSLPFVMCTLMIIQSYSAMSLMPLNSDVKTSSQGLSDLSDGETKHNDVFNDDIQKDLENIMNMQEFDTDEPKELDNSRIPNEASDIKPSTSEAVHSLPATPNDILDKIIGSMSDKEAPPHDSEESHENIPTKYETSTKNTSEVVTKTHMNVKISMNISKNDTAKHQENQMDNQIEKKPELDDEQYLNDLWNTNVPVLIKNNKASIHPNVELNDMSEVLPEMNTLLKKLKVIHKEGHITVIMFNPKSLRPNKTVVKKTKICCELRHILIKNSNKLPSMDSELLPDQLFPSAGEVEDKLSPSDEEEIHPDDGDSPWNHNEQTLVSSVLNNLHMFAKPQHLSALSFNPTHVVQNKEHLILLHLRIKLPAEIRGKAANSFRHQDIVPEAEPDEMPHSGSDENELANFGSYEHRFGTPKLFHVKFTNSADGSFKAQEIPLDRPHETRPSQDYGSNLEENGLQKSKFFEWRPSTTTPPPSFKVTPMKLGLHHRESIRIPDIHFDRLHETPFAHSQPELPTVKEVSPKKLSMVYFIMHKHPEEESPELQSFFKDVFQIPDTRNSVPSHEFVPEIVHVPGIPEAMFRHPFPDSYQESTFGDERNQHQFENSQGNDFGRMMELVRNSLEEMEHPSESSKPALPIRPFSSFRIEPVNSPRSFEPVGDVEDRPNLPFEIYSMFNTDGLNLFPSQGKFSASERD